MNKLQYWRELTNCATEYFLKHGKEILEEVREERKLEILYILPELLEQGNIVWCRDGWVCKEASECSKLDCKQKKNKSDIVNGCSICQNFQVRKPGLFESSDIVYVPYYTQK